FSLKPCRFRSPSFPGSRPTPATPVPGADAWPRTALKWLGCDRPDCPPCLRYPPRAPATIAPPAAPPAPAIDGYRGPAPAANPRVRHRPAGSLPGADATCSLSVSSHSFPGSLAICHVADDIGSPPPWQYSRGGGDPGSGLCRQRLIQVSQQVVDMLDAHRQAHHFF